MLSENQKKILLKIDEMWPVSMYRVAKELKFSLAYMYQTIAKIEAKGFITVPTLENGFKDYNNLKILPKGQKICFQQKEETPLPVEKSSPAITLESLITTSTDSEK